MDASNTIEYIKIGLMVVLVILGFSILNAIKSMIETLKDTKVANNEEKISGQATTNTYNNNNVTPSNIAYSEERVTEADLADEDKLVAILAAMMDASEGSKESTIKVKSIRQIG
ncbi:hypothetical protein [Clostridium sp.]|uniref:hypothetical protein n=1 Tax=Clostridium sp. TaxID=1506 RepID=UPI0034648BA8